MKSNNLQKSSTKVGSNLISSITETTSSAILTPLVKNNYYDKKFFELENRYKKKFKRLDEKLNKISTNFTETLGIFVALFTFVSVNFQIFVKVNSLNNAMVFMILMFFCLVGFVLFLRQTINNKHKKNMARNFIILIILLFVSMMIFMSPNYVSIIKPIPLDTTY